MDVYAVQLKWSLVERLGDDVFALSEVSETKHAFVEAVLASIVAGLILAFLTGVCDFNRVGQRIRDIIARVVSIARSNDVSQISPTDTQLIQLLRQLGIPSPFRHDRRRTALVACVFTNHRECTQAPRVRERPPSIHVPMFVFPLSDKTRP